jgi:kynurenine formamidase
LWWNARNDPSNAEIKGTSRALSASILFEQLSCADGLNKMKWQTFAVALSLALALLLFAQHRSAMPDPPARETVIDLTHTLDDHSPNWEGTERSPFQAKELGNLQRDGYYSRIFTTQEHYGTHLDAPAHFAANVWTVEQIPPERLVRPLVVLNVRAKALHNPEYEVSVQDVAEWERQHGQIPDGAVVMAYTGWEEYWDSQKKYRNEQADGLMHFPGFALQTAEFLVKTRNVVGLGIDTMSVDKGATTTYPIHQFTSRNGVYHLENVAGLGLVPPSGATIVVAPIKLEHGSGAPVRLFALVK